MNKNINSKSSFFYLMLYVWIICSCGRDTSLKIVPTRQFDIQYNCDTMVVAEKNINSQIFNYRFVLFNGEYYSIDNGKKELFFSVKRDTLIHGIKELNLYKTKTYIGKTVKSPFYRKGEDIPLNGKYVTECYIINSDVRDYARLQRAYYYNEDYEIVGIKEYGFENYR